MLILCLNELCNDVKGVSKSSSIIVLLPTSPFRSLHTCFTYVSSSILDGYILTTFSITLSSPFLRSFWTLSLKKKHPYPLSLHFFILFIESVTMWHDIRYLYAYFLYHYFLAFLSQNFKPRKWLVFSIYFSNG